MSVPDTTIHMVGYAHLDPVWLWRWTEGYQEARATFRSALDRMKEFPEYVFTCSQAAVYQWVEENDPAMFEEVVRRVNEGRWCIVGGWWMEADCNIPSGESFVRQGLYGQRYFHEKFGITAKVGFNADSFGHNAMIPQLIRKAGMDSYLFMRPNRIENPDCPSPAFRWKSPDGTTVLAYRLTHAYGTWGNELSARAVEEIAAWATESLRDLMMFYGVGNHGGGPTVQNLKSIEALRASKTLPRIVFGSPETYFARLGTTGDALPTHSRDWQHHASGCYAAHAEIKRLNRKAENVLVAAEKVSVLASCLADWVYEGKGLARSWQNVLFCQFHDIMAGTCIREAYDDVRDMFGETLRIAGHALNGAAQRIAGRIDTRGEGIPIVVFNPHSFPVRAVVECDMTRESASRDGTYTLSDESANPVPWQLTRASAVVGDRHRLCFPVDLPATGYRTYRVRPLPKESNNVPVSGESDGLSWRKMPASVRAGYATQPDGRDDLVIENRWFRMEIDGRRGDIVGLRDKRNGVDVFSSPAAVPIVIDDPSDTWSHGVFSFDTERGRFDDAHVRVVEEGPVRIVVRARSSYGDSTLLQDFTLYRDLPRISVRAVVDWHEKLSMLKLSFPVNVGNPVATCEIPYGSIERATNGEEEPGQRWIDVTGAAIGAGNGRDYGLSILNDSLYSYSVRGYDMRLTVLRSPVYAHHTPTALVPGEDYMYMDQGIHSFAYELLPHAGPWQDADTVRNALLLNAPPLALVEHVHEGPLSPAAELVRVSAPNVIVSAMKMREDGDDIIVRCHESAGRAVEALLEMPFLHRTIPFSIGPWEIKTWIVSRDVARPVKETSFLED